jgi:glucosamine-6-phosphate deaminase
MEVIVSASKTQLGARAAKAGAELIRRAVEENGVANVIIATGASQFEMLAELLKLPGIPWHKVSAFHLDEYVDVPITHPASFRKYLWERFHSKLPLPMRAFHYIDGDGGAPLDECKRMSEIIKHHPIDVALVGIGENGHLAFNDPPADFLIDAPYTVVNLDDACRRQQFGEGWFKTLEDVPKRAISMTCRQIMKSKAIIVSCPDRRKAKAVAAVVDGSVTPDVPSSVLQKHEQTTLYLDRESASLLKRQPPLAVAESAVR